MAYCIFIQNNIENKLFYIICINIHIKQAHPALLHVAYVRAKLGMITRKIRN